MKQITVTVQGRHSAEHPAERGRLRLAVHSAGADRDAAMTEVVESAASVRALLIAAGDAVTSATSDDVRTWTERPWSQDGRAVAPVFHAQVDLQAEFADFGRLSRVVDEGALLPGVEIHGVEWTLTDQSTATVLDDVRWKAVADATAKATAYAAALGYSTVVPVAVADEGMLDGSRPGGGGGPIGVMRSTMVASSESAGVSLTPQPIGVEVVVDARFTAS